jgi:hypothetical protein
MIDRKVMGMPSVPWRMTIRFIGSVSRQPGEFDDLVGFRISAGRFSICVPRAALYQQQTLHGHRLGVL